MELREATEQDIEAIADIYRHYVRTTTATLEEREPSTDTLRNEFSKVFASGAPFIVATERKARDICGYAYIGPFNDRSGYRFTCEDSIYIHSDYHGQGLGKQLLRELLERLKAAGGATEVIAKMSIAPDQAVEDSPSCRLHVAFGFRPVGRLFKVGYKFGGWVDVVILQASLESV